MQKTVSWLLVLLAAVPIVTINTITPAMDTKVLLYRAVAWIGSISMCLVFVRGQTRAAMMATFDRAWRSSIFKSMTISTGLLVISTIFAYDRYPAFFGTSDRGEGFLTLFALYILYVLFSLFFQKKYWERFFILSAWTSIAVFIVEGVQYVHQGYRPGSTIGNPIFLAGYFLFALFAGYYVCTQRKTERKNARIAPVLGVVTIGTSVVGILLTKTRGTLVGIGAALIVTLFVIMVRGKHMMIGKWNAQKFSGILLSIVVLFALVFGATRSAPLWQRVPGFNRLATTNLENSNARLLYLQMTERGFIKSTLQQKVIGWGWDNYKFFWDQNYDPKVYLYDISSTDRAHNKLADELIMTGMVGLLAYLAIWVFFIAKSLKLFAHSPTLSLGLLFVGTSYFVHNLFGVDIPLLIFSFYILLAFLTNYSYEK